MFDYLQVFLLTVCTEVCYKQHKIRSVFVAREPSATMERMGDEKVNLTFVDSFLYSCCFKKKSPHCVLLMWVSWGTFCLTVVILCSPLSCVCGIYESQAGSSVIFLSGWRFVPFRTWQGWQAACWNLRGFRFLLWSVLWAGRWDKCSGVCSSKATVLQGRWSFNFNKCEQRLARLAPSVLWNIPIKVTSSVTEDIGVINNTHVC